MIAESALPVDCAFAAGRMRQKGRFWHRVPGMPAAVHVTSAAAGIRGELFLTMISTESEAVAAARTSSARVGCACLVVPVAAAGHREVDERHGAAGVAG
jgi:hypothetical protein